MIRVQTNKQKCPANEWLRGNIPKDRTGLTHFIPREANIVPEM